MKCENCKNRLKNNEAFCGKCGSEVVKNKKSNKLKIIIVLICCFAIVLSGTIGGLYFYNQKSTIIKNFDGNYTCFTEGFTDVLVTDEGSAIAAVGSVSASLGIGSVTDELEISNIYTVKNDKYYRIQQYYHDVPVYGRSIVVSADNIGNVTTLTSNFKAVSDNINLEPKASVDKITKSIKNYFDLEEIQDLNINDDSLVIYNLDEEVLAYKLSIFGLGTVIVNANTAEVIEHNKILNDVTAEVYSEDGEISSIGWKNDDGSYHLYNDEHKIEVFDVKGINTVIDEDGSVHENFKNYGIDTLYSKNNKFDKDAIILLDDVIDISNYYKNLGYNGFDQVHIAINDSYDNGKNARGGGCEFDGIDCAIMLIGDKFDFANKDVVAHEYTHAVTSLLVGWNGSRIQTSALNEAYSDIFGTFYENPESPDWKMVHLSEVIRDLTDPSKTNCYDSMFDINESDNYSQYTLSTIISHSAYLMWNGIDGSAKRRINGEILSEMWYRSMLLLQSDADFSQCRNAVELSARIMLKNKQITEEQYKTVEAAFDTVGIESAAFTYTETVKNEFDLSVLSVDGTENVNFKLDVIKMPAIKAGPGLVNNEKPKLVIEKNTLTGRQALELEDGTYVLRITDLDEKQDNTQPINLKIIVDGESGKATDKVVVYTDFTDIITVVLDNNNETSENTTTTTSTVENKPDIQPLIDKYGLSSQKQFVSCQNAEVQEYPGDITGIVSQLEIDLNKDGTKELVVIRVSEVDVDVQHIIAEVYQNKNGKWTLSASQIIYDILYYTATNIYLFYSDVLSEYCIISESSSIGSIAGNNYWTAEIYTVSEKSIELYKKMDNLPALERYTDFKSEFQKIDVPFAKYCTTFDNKNNNSNYYLLCEVEHEIFGDSGSYMTRNHKLKIVDTSNKKEEIKSPTESNKPVISDDVLFKKYIEDNLTLNNTKNPQANGVFNIQVKDFDNDKSKEMVVFSIRNDEYSGAYLSIDLYVIKNATVKLTDSSEEFYYARIGAYDNLICATTKNNTISLNMTSSCSGGSQYTRNVLTYKINSGKLELLNHYYLYDYPRYERFDCLEKVSGKTFPTMLDFGVALEEAGYTDNHSHRDTENGNGLITSQLKGTHIFTIIDDCYVETYCEIYNNSNFITD